MIDKVLYTYKKSNGLILFFFLSFIETVFPGMLWKPKFEYIWCVLYYIIYHLHKFMRFMEFCTKGNLLYTVLITHLQIPYITFSNSGGTCFFSWILFTCGKKCLNIFQDPNDVMFSFKYISLHHRIYHQNN